MSDSLIESRDLAEQVLDGTLPYEEAWRSLAEAVIELTEGTQPVEVVPSYRINVERRKPSDAGYEADPYCASAWLGVRCVAIQYGLQPGIAFQKAWRVVQEDREREAVGGDV